MEREGCMCNWMFWGVILLAPGSYREKARFSFRTLLTQYPNHTQHFIVRKDFKVSVSHNNNTLFLYNWRHALCLSPTHLHTRFFSNLLKLI